MQHLMTRALLLIVLVAAPALATAQEATGRLSLVTNPRVMVYIDGNRVGMTPLINRSLSAGDHRMALLLILPNGNRLRADYRLVIAPGGETTASLDLVSNAPSEGEVRTIGPAGGANPPAANPPAANPPAANPPAANPPAANPPAANPPAANPPAGGGGWATNPGRPSQAPVSVAAPSASPPSQPEEPPEPEEPEVQYGLSREMVREGLEALRPAVRRCMEGRSGVIQIRLVIQPSGGVEEVEAQGIWRGTNTGDCIERTLPEEAFFPIYEGDPIPVVYPYRFAPQ